MFRWIYIGITHHELFQDVILDGTTQLLHSYALFFGRNNIESEYWQYRTIHGHGHTHLIQWNLVEENLHIQDRIDGHTGFTHIAYHTVVITVVAAVRSQVEGYRKSFLTGSKVPAVEGITLFCGTETGILAYGPWFLHIHTGIRAS
ncbi:hypothetical protein D3C72_1445640 [compost metagenome]